MNLWHNAASPSCNTVLHSIGFYGLKKKSKFIKINELTFRRYILPSKWKRLKSTLEIKNSGLRQNVDYIWNIEIEYREWRLAGIDAQNTVKCHGLPGARRGIFDVQHERCVLASPDEATSERQWYASGQLWHLTTFCTSDPANRYSRKSVSK